MEKKGDRLLTKQIAELPKDAGLLFHLGDVKTGRDPGRLGRPPTDKYKKCPKPLAGYQRKSKAFNSLNNM